MRLSKAGGREGVRARKCMGARHGARPREPATILHAETREMAVSCASPCVLRWACGGGGEEQEPFPHVTCRFGVVLGVPLLAASIISPHSCTSV